MNVIDSESGMFEQMGGLVVDLERIVVVKQIEIEQLSHQSLYYKRIQSGSGDPEATARLCRRTNENFGLPVVPAGCAGADLAEPIRPRSEKRAVGAEG